MKDTIFITEANNRFWEMAQDQRRSIHKFYPDYEVIIHPYTDTECIKSQDDQYLFQDDPGMSYDFLIPYFKNYKRVIFTNADFIMCSECPELFENYEFGCTKNNWDPQDFINDKKAYLQNGLMVVTNPEVFREVTIKNKANHGSPYYDMNSANDIFYSGKYRTKLFHFPDKIYGVSDFDLFKHARMVGNDIYCLDKKVCMWHFSGPDYKDYSTGKLLLNRFSKPVEDRLNYLIH